jgi:hypothetical protein
VTARLDYGWQLEDPGISDLIVHHYDSRCHFSVTVSY